MTAKAPPVLTHTQTAALRRIADKGSLAWCIGGRGGGATSRMCNRLVAAGYLEGPPFKITRKGREALAYVPRDTP